MNNKITFPELVDLIAQATNTTKRVSEGFLKELFAVISERLIAGDNVKIKNLGTFKVTVVDARKSVNVNTGEDIEIPSHRKVSFTPDKSMAEAMNMPFEGFETIVLDDDLSQEEIDKLMSTDSTDFDAELAEQEEQGDETVADVIEPVAEVVETDEEAESEQEEEQPAEQPLESVEELPEQIAGEVTPPPFVENVPEEGFQTEDVESESTTDEVGNAEEVVEAETQEIPVQPLISEVPTQEEPKPATDDDNKTRDKETTYRTRNIEVEPEAIGRLKKVNFWKGFALGACAILLLELIGWKLQDFVVKPKAEVEETEMVEPADSAAIEDTVVPAVVSPVAAPVDTDTIAKVVDEKPKVVTDTVSKKNFLTKMAIRHYGDPVFWVYIYRENQKEIGKNPNNIYDGQVMVIPPAEKYGIDKNNPESIKKARREMYIVEHQ